MECLPLSSSLNTSLIIFCIALVARALFSFLETSITAVRLFRLKELAASTNQYQGLFHALEKTPHRVLITILIADSLADVTTAALATHIMQTFFARLHWSVSLGFSLGIGLASIAILIFGEIIPKNIAKSYGDRLFGSTLWITNILFYSFYPLVTALMRLSDFIVHSIGGKHSIDSGTEWVSSEKEIQFLIDYISEKGLMDTQKTEMLQNIFDLGRTPVKEIMIPATDIVSVSVSSSSKDILDIFVQHRYTRLPVYEGRPDNFIGMVHLKDIFTLIIRNEEKPLQDIIRPIFFVPESVKVNQLLREFRQQHMHIAMVLNEHGSIVGLITLEDVLEEIVGEISDEHEANTENIIQLKQGGWLVNASTPLEELQGLLHITFVSENSLTLGGFLIEQLQHLPKKGERIEYKNFYFQVQKASPKRVLQVLIFKVQDAQQHTA
jgi:CBS domain containing-hemolysin-like protein